MSARRKMSECSTCDRCAEGEITVYLDDPDFDAWICGNCVEQIDKAIDAAAVAVEQAYQMSPGSWRVIAETAIKVYFKEGG